ncbi:MAG: alpha-L-fucosidase [Bacteroidales bacterium]|nr:alpha-L-fucosidase [Bacteroidales bacterium]
MKRLFISLFLLTLIGQLFSQSTGNEWDELRSRPDPQWFRDAKLGIFIHWSLSAVPAWSGKEQYAEWFLRGLLTGDSARIRFQQKVFGEDFKYEDYAALFKGELFDAQEWAELFEEAGARYVVLVSKHHDGYCLWPSKYAPGWNTMETGPHRDIVGELSEAVRGRDLKMGLYYSLPEWNHPLYRWGTDEPARVNNYVEKHMIPQFRELVSTYKPSLIFADGEWDHPASVWHSAELISWYYKLMGEEAIVNDRWGGGSEGIGFRTPEYSSGLVNSDRPWAEVRGLGRSFGLNRNEALEAYLTPRDLIHFFVKAVSNGGGMILNVGPYCDGQIPLLQQERLMQLGEWLKINGEAIYGSTPCPITMEEKDVTLERVDKELNFDWVRNSPGKPISEDHFTAEWNGYIEPLYSEIYQFEAEADDAVKVWIDNTLIVDAGNQSVDGTQSNVMEAGKGLKNNGMIKLQAGRKYPVRVEYQEKTQNAHLFLRWSSASQLKEVIPADRFSLKADKGSQPGLQASYRSKATWLCYTRQNETTYAVALEWPKDNVLRLNLDPADQAKIELLGRPGELPWKRESKGISVDLSNVKIAELPCEWAWVFRIGN